MNKYGILKKSLEIIEYTDDQTQNTNDGRYFEKLTKDEILKKYSEYLDGIYDTKDEAIAKLPTKIIAKALLENNLENELFETIELLKTKYVAFNNYLELEELKVRLQTIENKVNATTLPIPSTEFDGADLVAVGKLLAELETLQLNLFDGKKEKMEDYNGSIVWTDEKIQSIKQVIDPTEVIKIKEIEIHNVGDSVSQIKLEDLNLTLIKHISDTILKAEKKIDDALGITLSSQLVKLGQSIKIIAEDEPDDSEVVEAKLEVQNDKTETPIA